MRDPDRRRAERRAPRDEHRPAARAWLRAATLVAVASAILPAGCSSTRAAWRAGAVRSGEAEAKARPAESVTVAFKKSFGVFETTEEKRPYACHSVTLLRRMGLVEGQADTGERIDDAEVIAELTTDEYPRDEDRSRITVGEFSRVLGIGKDELDQFQVFPEPRSVERGVARLRALAAAVGADQVRDVFYTGYAEHQMWEGDALSLSPTSTSSPFYVSVRLLGFKLRDVRFHGTAVRRRGS